MNLANLGLSGLFAAQQRMQVSGHNLNNADVEGYNRQSVLTQTAGAVGTSAGFIGRGVQAVTVQRSYDSFLHNQLSQSQSRGAALITYGQEISKIDSLFSDPDTGISPALLRFFEGVQALASSPADAASRQELLGRSASLVTQINDTAAHLNQINNNINTQIDTTVKLVNSYLERIDNVNNQIVQAKGTNPGHEPNDLLDQRDQLLTELGQLIDIQSVEQNGRVSVSTGKGQLLLGGNTVYPLHAVRSHEDHNKVVLAYTASFDEQGKAITAQLKDSAVTGGSLGGLLKFRRDTLEPNQNNLGRMALSLAQVFNELHEQGYDLHGEPGQKFFDFNPSMGLVKSDARNSAGSIAPKVEITDANQLSNSDYQIAFDGTNYTISRLPGGSAQVITSSPMTLDGMTITVDLDNPPAAAHDAWLIQPTRTAAENLQLAMKDPDRIAAAGPDPDSTVPGGAGLGTANGDIALKLAELQNDKVMAGSTLSLNEGFAQIVNNVAVNTQQNATAAKAQAKLIEQNYASQQALSGVNMDEEYIKLDQYQQQYRAAARLIDISGQLFDTVLGLRA